MNLIFEGDIGLAPTNYHTVALALLLAFLFGQLFSWVYVFTHSGISYSRSFVVSLIVLPVLYLLFSRNDRTEEPRDLSVALPSVP